MKYVLELFIVFKNTKLCVLLLIKKIILFLFTILSLPHTKAIATLPLQQNSVKNFTEYCQQKSTLPKATKHTVEVLLKEAATQDCQQGNRKLRNLTELDLTSKQISDLKPLANLTNLTNLNLGGNQISDLKPLANLINLTNLNLGGNQIGDVKPLANLTNLTELGFYSNQISDIKSLSKLNNLTFLALGSNRIVDVKQFANFTEKGSRQSAVGSRQGGYKDCR
jgi:internalin A